MERGETISNDFKKGGLEREWKGRVEAGKRNLKKDFPVYFPS